MAALGVRGGHLAGVALPHKLVRYNENQIYARAWVTDSVGHKLPMFMNLRRSGPNVIQL